MNDIFVSLQDFIEQIGVEPLILGALGFALLALLLALIGLKRPKSPANLDNISKTLGDFNSRFSEFVSESASAREELKSKIIELHERLEHLEGSTQKKN